jgi:protoheme IX farnesyltransferase
VSTRVDVRTSTAVLRSHGERAARLGAIATDYLSLTKPRIIVLLLITELTSMVVAAHALPTARGLVAALVGGFCASGGSGALNCWWDRDIDAVMRRTAGRPLPTGRLGPRRAVVFGLAMIATAVAVLWVLASMLAALLALAGAVYYVAVYTMTLKRRTRQNIVIGGAAGAVPVLVGSVIATGRITPVAVALFAVIFLWTPPHSWALALVYRRDYAEATVPMLPAVVSEGRTLRAVLAYTVALVVVSLLPAADLGLVYLVPVAALGGYFLFLARRAQRRRTIRSSAQLFHYSLLYLAAVFACSAVAALLTGG